MEREKLGSRLGFILLSAGCAIGIGNVWKFPYMAGQCGGAAFVIFYVIFLLILGLPIMSMEFAVGRASQKSPVRAYNQLEKPGQKWHLHGYLCLIGNYLLMMFYTSVAGWMIHYFFLTISGAFVGKDAAGVGGVFANMLSNPWIIGGWMALVVIVGFLINSFGLQRGLERITKVMMVALLAVMVLLAVNSFMLPGAAEGLDFYLKPNFDRMMEVGIGTTVVGAMNQAFFTLSLGIGAMAIFGSYIGRDRALMGEAVNVAVLDTFVAIVSGLIIFPACFTYGVQPDAGPNLIFVTLPNVFNNLPLGRLWGSLFFIFMTFAAFSTILAVFENIVSCCMDLTGASRKKVAVCNIVAVILLSLPCVLGFNVLSGFQPFGAGSNVLDLEDFLVSNILLPLGSLVFLLFCTSRYGWGWKNFTKEANTGKGLKISVGNLMRIYCTYVLPVIVIAIFLIGINDKFHIVDLIRGALGI